MVEFLESAARSFKWAVNAASEPYWVFIGAFVLFVLAFKYYRTWTKPKYAVIPPIIYVLFMGFAVFGIPGVIEGDRNFRSLITKADNVPIIMLQILTYFTLWLALRQAAINDQRIENGKPPLEKTESDEKIFCWPDLVYVEFITAILVLVFLIVWSILIPAPLEEPANPTHAPNPSKAPWYFLGLQELLVYFDPWFAGVVLPTLIILGLMAIPYIDMNPRGSGYYTVSQRPMAIFLFLLGYLVFWIVYIQMGTFLRGPNWNFFGPFENWNTTKSPAMTNVDFAELFWGSMLGLEVLPQAWYIRELPGLFLVGFYLLGIPPILLATVPYMRKVFRKIGLIRWIIFIQLFLIMMAIPIKQFLRWTLSMKYIVNIDQVINI